MGFDWQKLILNGAVILLNADYQAKLLAAIASHRGPFRLFDFNTNSSREYQDHRDIEAAVSFQLNRKEPEVVRDGLSNILYVLSQNAEVESDAVYDFRSRVRHTQLVQALHLFDDLQGPGLLAMYQINLPVFSTLNLLSALRSFLDPHYIYLPERLAVPAVEAKLFPEPQHFSNTPSAEENLSLPSTVFGEALYEKFCLRCRQISSDLPNELMYRALDVAIGLDLMLRQNYRDEVIVLLRPL